MPLQWRVSGTLRSNRYRCIGVFLVQIPLQWRVSGTDAVTVACFWYKYRYSGVFLVQIPLQWRVSCDCREAVDGNPVPGQISKLQSRNFVLRGRSTNLSAMLHDCVSIIIFIIPLKKEFYREIGSVDRVGTGLQLSDCVLSVYIASL